MSYVAKARMDATRVANGKAKPSSRVGVSTSATASNVDDFLVNFPIQLRRKVLKKGIRKAGNVVIKSAKPRVNLSAETGTRKGWSKKVQEQRAKLDTNLRKSIGMVVREYDSTIAGFVGPRWGRHGGNIGWIYEHGATIYLWGDKRFALKGKPFLRPAAKETSAQQDAAIIGTLKSEWQKV